MITDDEVMDRFARADPARAEDTSPSLDAAAYLDALRTRSEYGADSPVYTVQVGPEGGEQWRRILAVAAAAVLVVVGALLLGARGDPPGSTTDRTTTETDTTETDTTTTTTDTTTTVTTEVPEDPPATGRVRVADRLMAARNAHDAAAAMALVADDGVVAQLCWQSLLPPYACLNDVPSEPVAGRVRLDHDAVALAFEAERIYGVQYRSYACEQDPGPFVTCTYDIDSRLRRIAGLPPVAGGFDLRIEGGRVHQITFPWLNIGFDPGGYYPREFEPFIQWLQRAHPEALNVDQTGDRDGLVFRTSGQELFLDLTRPSLDLLAGYLDEYEAGR